MFRNCVTKLQTAFTTYMAAVAPEPLLPYRLQALSCPVCMELAFDAMSNRCGHTFCGVCAKKLKRCPLCRENVELLTNYMVRSVLDDDPEVEDHRKRYKQRVHLETPEGRIHTLKEKHPGLTYTKEKFTTAEVACILEWINVKLSDPASPRNVHPFGPRFLTVWSPSANVTLGGCQTQHFQCCVGNETILVLPFKHTTKLVMGSCDNHYEEPVGSYSDEDD